MKKPATRAKRGQLLYLVYNKHGSVAFHNHMDALYAARGQQDGTGVNTLADAFRETFVDGHGTDDDAATRFPIIEIRLPATVRKLRR